ncbi:thioredoxin-disulfide reductase, partial [gut metagenome]
SGTELHHIGLSQLASLQIPCFQEEVLSIEYDNLYVIHTSKKTYRSKSLILATGIKRNMLSIQALKPYESNGISYCAVCDGFFYRQKQVAVLGNGVYALHEGKVLEPLASKVTILTNGKEPLFSLSDLGTMEINTKKIQSAGGDPTLQWIAFEDKSQLPVSGLFVALGTADSTDLARKLGLYIENNHIHTEKNTSTALPGLFACGDCTGGMLQIAKAVYEGALAGTQAVSYV